MLRALAFAAALNSTVACSGSADSAAPADAGSGNPVVDASADSGSMLVDASPDADTNAVQLPLLTPCSTGWREVDVEGLTSCDAWPATGQESCTGASAHLPGTLGCQALGSACPSSGWATNLPVGASILYVDAAAPNGMHNGSQANPYASISQALNQANPGQILALAAGDYVESLVLTKDVTLWGACPETTRIVASAVPVTDRDRDSLVTVDTASAGLRELTVFGGFPTFEITAGSGLELQSALVTNAASSIELANGSSLVTNTVKFAGLINVQPGDPACADPLVNCAELASFHINALSDVDLSLSITLESTVFEGSAVVIGEESANSTTVLNVDRVVANQIINSRGLTQVTDSVLGSVRGATLVAENSEINKVTTFNGATLRRLTIRQAGLFANGPVAGYTMEDVVVRSPPSGTPSVLNATGVALVADAELRRVALVGAEGIGVRVEEGAQVLVEDLLVKRTVDNADGSALATALGLYDQSRATIDRFDITGSDLLGVQLMGAADLVLNHGAIENCAIGANVQVDGFDLGKLQSNVRYENNQVDIDSQTLMQPPSLPEWQCDDGIDNDGDQRIDCADQSCAGFVGCPPL